MHLAVESQKRPASIDDHRRIVKHPCHAPLENRTDNHHVQFRGQLGKALRSGTRDGLGQIEGSEIFGLAEIPRTEEFLDADNLRAFGGGLADSPFHFGEIFIGVERAGHLNQPNPKLGLLHKTIVTALGILQDST